MYNNSGIQQVVAAGVTGGMGAAMLPHTANNPLAMILAYGAITIGAVALISQLVVRIVRNRTK